MRKIEKEMLAAVEGGRDWHSGNTAVFFISSLKSGNPHGARSEVFLHGHHIASYWHKEGTVEINTLTLADWPSRTTMSRLRALGANVYKRNHIAHVDGEPIH